MTWQTRKHTGPTIDDVSQPCRIIADVALANVDYDWSDDVAADCAELLLCLLTSWWGGGSTQFSCRNSGEEGACGACGVLVRVDSPDVDACWRVMACSTSVLRRVFTSGFLSFFYTMVCLKTRFENFDFWVWIKHPLFQEQALIPVVRIF